MEHTSVGRPNCNTFSHSMRFWQICWDNADLSGLPDTVVRCSSAFFAGKTRHALRRMALTMALTVLGFMCFRHQRSFQDKGMRALDAPGHESRTRSDACQSFGLRED